MTNTSNSSQNDTILPFQLDHSDIRGRVARLDGVLNEILAQHNYPAVVEAMVAEATLLTALIGQSIDLRWKLSLQIRGDGPLRIIATDYFSPHQKGEPAKIRAYASFDAKQIGNAVPKPFSLIGKGFFAVLIDQGGGTEPYQGITPLAGGSLAACAETYFAQSEQLPTRFQLSMGQSVEAGETPKWRAGGVLLQHMPKASPHAKDSEQDAPMLAAGDLLMGEEEENWNRANILLDSVEQLELIGPHVSLETMLYRLFHEEAPRIHAFQRVRFGCTCSADKVRQTMSIYSTKDIAHMTDEKGQVTADCQFCGAHYMFDPATLGMDAKPAKQP